MLMNQYGVGAGSSFVPDVVGGGSSAGDTPSPSPPPSVVVVAVESFVESLLVLTTEMGVLVSALMVR